MKFSLTESTESVFLELQDYVEEIGVPVQYMSIDMQFIMSEKKRQNLVEQ